MKYLIWLFVGLTAIFSIFVCLSFFYQSFGGKYIFDFIRLINQKNWQGKNPLTINVNEIWGKSGTEYGGVIMTVNNDGVWVWGKSGPRFFTKKDGVSVYYFYDACNVDNLEKVKENKTFTPEKEVYFNISIWEKKIKTGQYAIVKYRADNNSQLWEIYGYSYWPFSSESLTKQCQKF